MVERPRLLKEPKIGPIGEAGAQLPALPLPAPRTPRPSEVLMHQAIALKVEGLMHAMHVSRVS